MTTNGIHSWGRYFHHQHSLQTPSWRSDLIVKNDKKQPVLAYGLGRSYGDSCLNDQGVLISSQQLNHFISFDKTKGILRCEAGVSIKEVLDVSVPAGWFMPVTPGTKFVTVAGALANDVHGKNHNKVGTLGCHVNAFELLRSNGDSILCSRNENVDLFKATIGGLGLTGFITWVELQLIPVVNGFIEEESIQFENLNHCLELFEQSENDYLYTVAWIDCLAQGKQAGRGIFTRGNHCQNAALTKNIQIKNNVTVPFTFPRGCLNKLTVKAFNELYYRKLGGSRKESRMTYDGFFYPLDSILEWNRLYGPKGFIQYQCVLVDEPQQAMDELLTLIAQSGQPSPLNVLKNFGDIDSPGLLSFPRKGLTLALDFPNRGEKTLRLLNELDVVVKESSGALYPAKDSRMSAEMFELSFPHLNEFKKQIDPQFSSSFWRRVQA